MAEDLRGTRPVAAPGGAAANGGTAGNADGGTGSGGPADAGGTVSGGQRRPDELARNLQRQDLSSRTPRVAMEGDAVQHPVPVRRWSSAAHSVPEIERELNRIWGSAALRSGGDGENHVAARSSVLNLVVVAPHREIADRCAAIIGRMAGRHPSRSMILSSRDPEGPPGIDAQIEAHCVMPTSGRAETCAEMIYISTSGDTSRHLAAIIVPLLVHDLPVALWWPHDPQLRSHRADRLLPIADRLIVDASSWSGNGLDRLVEMAAIAGSRRLVVADFALIRQSRWREAVASVYDTPDLRSHLRAIRSVTVEYATAQKSDTEGLTNVVKPIYHVAWLASRLGMSVLDPLHHDGDGRRVATLRQRSAEVAVTLRPVVSDMPPGTTLRVEIASRRLGHEVVGDITAEQQTVDVVVREDGHDRLHRSFLAPRQSEVDLLAQAVEESRPDPIAVDALAMASRLITGAAPPSVRAETPSGRATRPATGDSNA